MIASSSAHEHQHQVAQALCQLRRFPDAHVRMPVYLMQIAYMRTVTVEHRSHHDALAAQDPDSVLCCADRDRSIILPGQEMAGLGDRH